MVRSTNDGDEWQNEAKCAGEDVEQFFARLSESDAKKFCKMCPVKSECLDYSLIYDTYGIWGGTTYKERKRKYSARYRAIIRGDYEDSGLYNPNLKV
jgi:WhiB family redox-sensing transcriptional regulator